MATFAPSTHMDGSGAKWDVRFVPLPHAVMMHPTYAKLSGGSVKLLLTLASDYMGKNNGHLIATVARMSRIGIKSKESIANSLRQLIDLGFVIRTHASVVRDPAMYAISWLPINEPPRGQKYDAGILPGNQALDLWRNVDPCTLSAAA